MATIKQIKDTEGNIHDILSTIGYGTCATAAATAAKVATIDDTSWTLKVGSIIGIKYTYINTAGSLATPVTLNVNNTGAKNIWYNNAKYTSTSSNICGYANRVIYYMYDGTYWVWMNSGALDGNSNTVPCIQIETAAATAAKVGTCTNYSLLANSYAHANIRYSNTLKSALTLNVNSKGAKPIYINGTPSSSSNYTLPAGTYIIYYDGSNYHFRTDGVLPGKILNANHATTAEYAESCERAIISDLAIGDENGNNIISTYVTRSDFGSLTDNVNRIESDFTGFTVFAEETYTKSMLSVTHSQLVNLRDNGKLIPGQQYRITDYVTTTSQENTESAGHQFDIIVTANSNNTLSEIASACIHEGDTYFSENNANLSAWQIWYCLDNDSSKFEWADGTNGKGVIYRMIDEWGNDCPYDFKNIKFKKPIFSETDTPDSNFYYTFCRTYVDIKDISIIGNGNTYKVYNNVIKPYYVVIKNSLNSPISTKQSLNRILFINKLGNYCYSNTFGDDCYSNTFGDRCSNNTFGNGCDNNKFGIGCDSNTFGNGCTSNTFGTNCHDNTFGTNCNYNTFGNNCYNNIFGTVNSNNELVTNAGSCSRNTFGTNCYKNKLFNTCNNNSFDIDCHDNEFGTSCTYNKFDTLCAAIKFGSNCSYNTLGNGCTNITFGISSTIRSYYRRIIIDSGNRYIYLNCGTSGSSKYYQNVRIGLGVNNTNTYKTIADGNINQTFETYYKPSESQTILI